ncbi:hypothetical protein MMPV_009060 [Pyropia vietnamensis]
MEAGTTPASAPAPGPSRLRRLLQRRRPSPMDAPAGAAGRRGGSGGGSGGGSDSGDRGSDGGGSGVAPTADGKAAAASSAAAGAADASPPASDSDGSPPALPPVSFFTLFRYASHLDWVLLGVGTAAAIGHGAMLPLFALLFGDLIDAGNSADVLSPTVALDATKTAAWKLILLGGVSGVLSFLQVACWMASSQRQAVRIRTLFTSSLLRQEMGYYDGLSSGTLTAHVTGDVAVIQAGMGEKIATIIQLASTAIAGFAVAFAGSWKLTLVVLSTAPALAAVGGLFGKFAAEATVRGQKSYAAAGAVAEEALALFRTVVAYGGEDTEAAKYERLLRRAAREEERRAHLMGVSIGISMFIMMAVYGLSFWYGGRLVRSGEVTSGSVVTVFFAIIISAMGLGQTAPGISAVHAARGAAPRVFEVIERVSAIDPLDDAAGIVPPAVDGRLALRDVGFAYPSHPDRPVLRGTSVSVGKGQTLALVGASGCGKTTVVQLLERLYDADTGTVEVGGFDVRDLNVQWLRSQIGFVPQSPVLFTGTIRENIALGGGCVVEEVAVDAAAASGAAGAVPRRHVSTREVTDADIIAAAKAANAFDFITALPDGFATQVGTKGGQLSGGQRQRVCIARALVANPAILLADEATASLDTASERVVQDALARAGATRTTVVIAHRLSTVQAADAIAVLGEGGRVIEAGTHSELVARPGGRYRQMVELQTLTDESPAERARRGTDRRRRVHELRAEEGGVATTTSDADAGPARDDGEEEAGVAASAPAAYAKVAVGSDHSAEGISTGDTDESSGISDEKALHMKVDMTTARSVAWRVLRSNRREAPYLVLGVLGAVGSGAAWPIMAIIYSEVIVLLGDTSAGAAGPVNRYSGAFVALGGCMALVMYLQVTMLSVAGERLTLRLRMAAFRAMLRQEVAFFDATNHSVGALSTQLAAQVPLIKGLTGETTGTILMVLASICTGLVVAFLSCWKVALVTLAFTPGVAAGGALEMRRLTTSDAEVKKAYQGAGAVLSEMVDNIRTVTTLGVQREFLRRFQEKLREPITQGRKMAIVSGVGTGLSEVCTFAIWAVALWYGAKLGVDGDCDFLDTLKALTVIIFSFMMIGQAATAMPDLAASITAAAKVFSLVDRPSAIDATAPLPPAEPAWESNEQRLSDVAFSYPSRPGAPVLTGLSVVAPPGSTVALVGSSGCGKSSTLALLQRLYDPTDGLVSHGGISLDAVHPALLRARLAVIPQEPALFTTTFRDNIAYGLHHGPTTADGAPPVVTDEAVAAAAAAAGATAFIDAAGGLDATVGQRGAGLSGGQRQRIAVARALIRRPSVLLSDEATSALDSASEAVVAAALAGGGAYGRTTILVAHRLSTVKDADAIVVVVNGAVAEVGRHTDLIARGGVYAGLVRDQEMDA